jgi:hypothetical protein
VGVRLHLAELVRQSGNRDFAIRILQDVLRIEPGNADATGLLRQMAPEGR